MLDRQTDDDGNDGNDGDDAGRARVRRWGRRGGGVEAENAGVDRGGTSETTESADENRDGDGDDGTTTTTRDDEIEGLRRENAELRARYARWNTNSTRSGERR